MRRILFLVWLSSLLLPAGLAHAAIYKVIDEHGNVSYTDIPPADQSQVEPMKLPAINTQPRTQPRNESPVDPEEEHHAAYLRAAISSPTNESTLPAGEPNLTIEVSLEPDLQPGHWVQILVDGSAAGSPAQSTQHQLQHLERGMHFISAHVLDSSGRIVAETDTVTVQVQRPTVGGHASGQSRPPGSVVPRPAPRPAPK